MIYNIFSSIIIALALAGAFQMGRLAAKHPKARIPFIFITLFCFYAALFYFWILVYSPIIGQATSTGGRVLVIFLTSSVVMLGTLMDK